MIIHFDSQMISLICRKITVCIQLVFLLLHFQHCQLRQECESQGNEDLWVLANCRKGFTTLVLNHTTEESINGLLFSEREQVHKIVIKGIRK